MSHLNLARVALLAVLALQCGPPPVYGKSVYGTVGGYSMKNVHASPASVMVARKVPRPLYIVLDPAKVKDVWQLQTNECEFKQDADGCEHFKLLDMHEFVRRDLKHAMESYFSRVEVVDSASKIPEQDYVQGDIKIDSIKLRSMVTGMLNHVFIQMTWSFAMRPSGAVDYAYSFGGTAESNDTYATFEAGCAQLVENAIPEMLKKWVDEGGVSALADRTEGSKKSN